MLLSANRYDPRIKLGRRRSLGYALSPTMLIMPSGERASIPLAAIAHQHAGAKSGKNDAGRAILGKRCLAWSITIFGFCQAGLWQMSTEMMRCGKKFRKVHFAFSDRPNIISG
jgi:hypothetical protein